MIVMAVNDGNRAIRSNHPYATHCRKSQPHGRVFTDTKSSIEGPNCGEGIATYGNDRGRPLATAIEQCIKRVNSPLRVHVKHRQVLLKPSDPIFLNLEGFNAC